MESLYLSIGIVASFIGVSTKTLRCWDKKGIFRSIFRTYGNHRRYCKRMVLKYIRKRKEILILGGDKYEYNLTEKGKRLIKTLNDKLK